MALKKISGVLHQAKQSSFPVEPFSRAKLLYVEDNDANWDVANLLLRGSYELTRARSAKEVVSILGQSEFDIILMDIELGRSDLDGIGLTKLLRGRLAERPEFASKINAIDTPLIFVTAYSARYKDSELESYGGDGVVHKPIDPDELTRVIWKILNGHRVATIAAQKSQLSAEKQAREIQEKALEEIQGAHEKLRDELRNRKEVEGELELMRDELQQAGLKLKEAQKLATYGELIASIAHEINNPISSGLGSISLLEEFLGEIESSINKLFEGQESDEGRNLLAYFGERFEEVREVTGVVELSYSKLRDISEALRMGSRRSSGFVNEVDLNEIVMQSMVLVAGRVQVFQPDLNLGELPDLACQPNYLGQVVINLLTNAADAMQEQCDNASANLADQSMYLETRAGVFDERDGIFLTLEDSGPGVPQSIREKIFESFFTTKPHGIGTGLGLAISIKIIKEHFGHIEVGESSRLGGARFQIWLPLKQPSKQPS